MSIICVTPAGAVARPHPLRMADLRDARARPGGMPRPLGSSSARSDGRPGSLRATEDAGVRIGGGRAADSAPA
eukprot:4121533-Pyramimonas_sp.AAC.1